MVGRVEASARKSEAERCNVEEWRRRKVLSHCVRSKREKVVGGVKAKSSAAMILLRIDVSESSRLRPQAENSPTWPRPNPPAW